MRRSTIPYCACFEHASSTHNGCCDCTTYERSHYATMSYTFVAIFYSMFSNFLSNLFQLLIFLFQFLFILIFPIVFVTFGSYFHYPNLLLLFLFQFLCNCSNSLFWTYFNTCAIHSLLLLTCGFCRRFAFIHAEFSSIISNKIWNFYECHCLVSSENFARLVALSARRYILRALYPFFLHFVSPPMCVYVYAYTLSNLSKFHRFRFLCVHIAHPYSLRSILIRQCWCLF